ncbi:hypothetical protein ARMGADRAFT_934716, partial [Armillaria gallica]
ALVRDGFRCVVSGKYDQTTRLHSPRFLAPTDEIWEAGVVYTVCTHCARVHVAQRRLEQQGGVPSSLASVLAVLKSFGDVIEQLNGTNLHSLSDIITMQSDVHEWFTRLEN